MTMRTRMITRGPSAAADGQPLRELYAPDTDTFPDVMELVACNARRLEEEILPDYLRGRRWFAAKDRPLKSCRIASIGRLRGDDPPIALYEVETGDGTTTDRWLLPLAVVRDVQPLSKALAVARIGGGASGALLTDAFSQAEFARRVVHAMATRSTIETPEGELVCDWLPAQAAGGAIPDGNSITWLSAEQSNSSLIINSCVMFKIFRRIASGPHPEAEMSRYLTACGFRNSPALLGEIVRCDPAGQRQTLAVAQAFVSNQGDAWNWTLQQFARYLQNVHHDSVKPGLEQAFAVFAAAVGRRLGEMHAVLARATDDAAFAAQTATPDDVATWVDVVDDELARAYSVLARASLDRQAKASLKELLQRRDDLFACLPRLAVEGRGSVVCRIHGDFHLGQVLVADDDAYIIDFEGEPSRPLEERRAKASPLNDVAGMLRSFRYALAMATKGKPSPHGFPAQVRREVLEPLVLQAESAFLGAYRESVRGLPGLDTTGLLDLFLVRKAAYEIGYEAANRPDWLPVPTQGLLEIARRISSSTAQVVRS
jgi:maltose alpha-D-glucosyltransferase / alpha-amylase